LREYFSSQAASMTLLIRVLGYTVGAIMSVGALFGALNSMYAAVAARTKEIAILRALGFGTVPIILSVLLEAAFLGLTGGLAGILAADALFNGYTAATLGADFSQVVFAFRVTPPLMAHALLIALAIGLVGGLIPAVSAARLPVISALRMTR
jgi:putative ABC transport system permease protein